MATGVDAVILESPMDSLFRLEITGGGDDKDILGIRVVEASRKMLRSLRQ